MDGESGGRGERGQSAVLSAHDLHDTAGAVVNTTK